MKKLLLSLALIGLTFTMNAQGWRQGEMEIRVEINDQPTADQIIKLGLDGDFYPGGAVLYVIPEEARQLRNAGVQYEILKDDLNAHFKNFWNNRDAYHSYQEIVDLADSLAEHYPNICQKVMFGTSIEGRELAALKISDNASDDENEAEILFDGGIHGDEIGGAENCIRFARDLCTNYGSDPDITFLVDNREIWIYYMVNPDGRENMERYNAAGVDCNRDYGYMWDEWGGSTGAFSQVETKSLRNCSYQNQFVVHTTYHSGTEYISCPWSYRPETPADMDHILQLAGLYSSLSGYANLEYGQGNSGMYAINGSTKDGNYGVAGSISWSMEISMDKQPSASLIMQYYNWNYPSMMAMIEYAGYGLEGSITNANTGNPVRATVFINDYMQCYSDSTLGDFHKYVLPGKYSITVMANGYETQTTVDSVEVTALSSSIQDFQMVPLPDSRWYAWRMISSRIPDNNTVDEGNTMALIGAPDMVNYSIGKNGWVVVDMQKPVLDRPGNDIKIYEGDITPEGFSCYASTSMDGPWVFLGPGEGTTEFELAPTGLSSARYFKIVDDGDGPQNAQDAGFDLDAISDLEHDYGVSIVMLNHQLDDENGNGHLEAGESADLIITLANYGNIVAENVEAGLSSISSSVNITQASASFGTLTQNQSAEGTFSFEVGEAATTGDTLFFSIDVLANGGLYNTSFELFYIIGQFPVLVVDLDGNHNSGSYMQTIFSNIDVEATYTTAFPDNLDLYRCVFVCLGVKNDAHTLSSNEGDALASYLGHGGRLYMEGGDTWTGTQTAVHNMFKIDGLSNGFNDLGLLFGQTGSFAEGLVYQYTGDNEQIDRIVPIDNAFELFRNQVPAYCNAVALDEGTYKTVGVSFEFAGLNDNQNTREELMILILEFFGGVLTNLEEPIHDAAGMTVRAWPNPFSEKLNFSVKLEKQSTIILDIIDLSGRIVHHQESGSGDPVNHQFIWEGTSNNGQQLPEGMYLYLLKTDEEQQSGKIILSR